MARPPEGVLIGAGERGAGAYASHLLRHPEVGRIVAVAEPDRERRERFARRHGIEEGAAFDDWPGLLDGPRRGDFALVATPDPLHVAPALRALEAGHHVLLEKPMALCEADCRDLVEASERTGRLLQICHVARYAPLFQAVKRIVASGEIGDVVTIQHSENVSYWHYAHSYCRGQWRNAAASSPMILAKSCHDLDLLVWLAGARPARLTSLARPTELCADKRPPGAPDRCIEGCPHAARCPYDAVAIYADFDALPRDLAKTHSPRWLAPMAEAYRRSQRTLERLPLGLGERLRWNGWPRSVLGADTSREGVERALRETRYGLCVYAVGDNDQVSSQTVNVLFENGVNASFTMHSTSHREGRETRIDGTRGSLFAGFYNVEQRLVVHDHKTGRARRVRLPNSWEVHGGGDTRLFADFLAAVRGESEPATTARESLDSHRMAFAADRAQREGVVVDLTVG